MPLASGRDAAPVSPDRRSASRPDRAARIRRGLAPAARARTRREARGLPPLRPRGADRARGRGPRPHPHGLGHLCARSGGAARRHGAPQPEARGPVRTAQGARADRERDLPRRPPRWRRPRTSPASTRSSTGWAAPALPSDELIALDRAFHVGIAAHARQRGAGALRRRALRPAHQPLFRAARPLFRERPSPGARRCGEHRVIRDALAARDGAAAGARHAPASPHVAGALLAAASAKVRFAQAERASVSARPARAELTREAIATLQGGRHR